MTHDINRSLLPKTRSFLGIRLNSNINKNTRTTNALSNGRNRIDKAAKKRGLTTVHEEIDGKDRIDLFYQDCFAGWSTNWRREVNWRPGSAWDLSGMPIGWKGSYRPGVCPVIDPDLSNDINFFDSGHCYY